jgi:L-aspartate oxidase
VLDTELSPQPVLPRAQVQQAMTAHAGVVRDGSGLDLATAELARAAGYVPGDIAALEDSALTITAQALVLAARLRTESRGCHTRADYPHADDAQRRSVAVRLTTDGVLAATDPRLAGVL